MFSFWIMTTDQLFLLCMGNDLMQTSIKRPSFQLKLPLIKLVELPSLSNLNQESASRLLGNLLMVFGACFCNFLEYLVLATEGTRKSSVQKEGLWWYVTAAIPRKTRQFHLLIA